MLASKFVDFIAVQITRSRPFVLIGGRRLQSSAEGRPAAGDSNVRKINELTIFHIISRVKWTLSWSTKVFRGHKVCEY